MDSRTDRPRWEFIALILILCFGLAMLSSCSPRIHERVVYQKDTTYLSKVDSVYKYERDSVYILEKGDTVYKYVERVRYRDRYKIDTLVKVKVDSLVVERTKEVKVEKPLSWWKSFQIGAFWWLCAMAAGLLLWTFRKQLLRLIGF